MVNQDKVITACYVDDLFAHPSFPGLCSEAAAECANPELTPPAPDQGLYRVLENNGAARCFRCGEGEDLFGFALVLVAPSGHNGKRYATVESLFVERKRRSSALWMGLKRAIGDAGRDAGCERVFYSAHAGTALARLLFLSPDEFELTNYIFCQRLS